MPLTPGTRVGSYEIVSVIGAGGMGEVYRARDTRLGRDVAVKVVSESVSHDPARVARFQSEAQLLAALNHPHIATIHGLEESASGQFLVMELVEGETLADRLKSGPIPVNEALGIARQIADALQAAHEKGIIHRDLKPANIALTSNGQVKVLDFGLAKMLEGTTSGDASISPTMSLAFTQAGMILGTAAYMAPEQARGKPVDKRSDIWAFGCVLYEMLTGKRAFDGEDAAVVLASVIKGEPDWPALPPTVTTPVVTLLRSCLEKDPHKRSADIAAATFVLDHAAELVDRTPVAPTQPAVADRRPIWRRAVVRVASLAVTALLAGAAVWMFMRSSPPAVVRMTINTSGSSVLAVGGTDPDVAITPDGSRIVYRGNNQLLVRALNQIDPSVLTGLGPGPKGVFTSPDGQWIGFFDGANVLKKVAITGGPPVTLCNASGGPRGATWSDDGTIVFASAGGDPGLHRVSAAGGDPVVLTRPERSRGEANHLWPEFLPGGKSVLFTIFPTSGGIDNGQIALLDLQTGATKVLIRGGSHAHYLPTGHIVYGAAGTLRGVAFDLRRLEVVGTPAPVLQGVLTTNSGAADVAIAANGTLVYVPGTAGGGGQLSIAALDRHGQGSPVPGIPAGSYHDVRVSPDGSRLAIATQDDVWTYDLTRATLSRLTTDPAADTGPLWTGDSQRIVFTSSRAGYPEIFWKPADGTGRDERLFSRGKDLLDLRGTAWSLDGHQMLIMEVSSGALRCAIEQIPIERPSDVRVLVKNEFCNVFPAISPDGRWIAYQSNLSGRYEIYAERYPESGNRQQISTGSGRTPAWSRDGQELFFHTENGRQMFAVPVRSASTLVAGRQQALFETALLIAGGVRSYDVAPDGRFFVIRSAQPERDLATTSNMILVLNWFEELKRLVPAN